MLMKKIYFILFTLVTAISVQVGYSQCSDSFNSFSTTVCDTYTVPSGDETYTSSGVYNDTIPNFGGCDSILTITLTVNYSDDVNYVVTACDSYTWNMMNLTTTGTYIANFTNMSGCDSTETLDLTILNSTAATINETACASYTVPSGDETYTSSGTYMDTIPNTVGCDSVLTINLTILGPTYSAFTIDECDSYTVPSGDESYTVSGTYTDTIPNYLGCDSIMTITLNLNYSTGSTHTATSCISYTYNSQTYTSSGTYYQTFTNSVGCDSIITLELTIHEVDIDVTQNGGTFSAGPTGVWFQWLDCNDGMAAIPGEYYIDFTPAVNGSYAVEVMTLYCKDTSACYYIDNVGLDQNSATSFVLYPNPANTHVTIQFEQTVSNAVIQIVNVSGAVVTTQNNANGTSFTFDLSTQPAGIYFVEFYHNGLIERAKISKL